jgi:hypothetical protein
MPTMFLRLFKRDLNESFLITEMEEGTCAASTADVTRTENSASTQTQ